MKEVLAYNSSVIGFSVFLIREKLWDRNEELLTAALADDSKTETYDFESFTEAEAFLLEQMLSDNDFYYGLITYYEFNYDSDCENNLGELLEYRCVAEIWVDDIEEDEFEDCEEVDEDSSESAITGSNSWRLP